MSQVEILLHSELSINSWAIRALYSSAGWWPERTEAEIAQVLNDNIAVGAWDGKHLIGFARAVSDGYFRAFIEDVIVDPAYQHMGLGDLLLAKLLASLSNIETISLFCEADLILFYEREGFHAFSSQSVLIAALYKDITYNGSRRVY